MKTATLPSVRVAPEVRDLAQSVLKEGESLSMFIEDSIKRQAHYRQEDAAFLARALQAADDSKAGTQRSYSIDEVVKGLREITAKAKQANGKVA